MYIMVRGVVAGDVLERIPRQLVATVVVYGFGRGDAEEEDGLAGCEPHEQVSHTGTDGVEEEAFDRVVVKSTVGIGDVEAMMAGVEGSCY
jgi:hypothetical protein